LCPESVARENVVIPLGLDENTLKLATADPTNYESVTKLQFILNKEIKPVLAVQEQIQEAINKNYGQSETESVDSMLVEFTDTAIEFTQMENANALAASGSGTASTAFSSSATPRRAACWPPCSPASKSWDTSTSVRSAARRTGGSR
jgi:type IV pilus assembly protein PilB